MHPSHTTQFPPILSIFSDKSDNYHYSRFSLIYFFHILFHFGKCTCLMVMIYRCYFDELSSLLSSSVTRIAQVTGICSLYILLPGTLLKLYRELRKIYTGVVKTRIARVTGIVCFLYILLPGTLLKLYRELKIYTGVVNVLGACEYLLCLLGRLFSKIEKFPWRAPKLKQYSNG